MQSISFASGTACGPSKPDYQFFTGNQNSMMFWRHGGSLTGLMKILFQLLSLKKQALYDLLALLNFIIVTFTTGYSCS